MEIKDIQNFIEFVAKSDVAQVTLERDGVKICIKNEVKKNEVVASQQPNVAFSGVAPTDHDVRHNVCAQESAGDETEINPKYKEITSPMVGTFYRKSKPKSPNLVEVGSLVTADTDVCVLEAMKTFNEVKAGLSGKIVEILVDDASPVEFGQPLFLVDPS